MELKKCVSRIITQTAATVWPRKKWIYQKHEEGYQYENL
jgi:hypothetical protein